MLRTKKNFAEGEEKDLATSAVKTAELVSILDVDTPEEVKVVAEATGASEEFVKEVAELTDEVKAAVAAPEAVVEEAVATFSKKVNEACAKHAQNFSKTHNFSECEGEKCVAAIAEVASLISDEALIKETPEQIVEVVAEATEAPKEIVEPIVEAVAFSAKRVAHNLQKSFSKVVAEFKAPKYFADATQVIEKQDKEAEPIPEVKPEEKPELKEDQAPVEPVALDKKDIEQSEPKAEEITPEGDPEKEAEDAGKGMVAAEELATVTAAENVPEPAVFSVKPKAKDEGKKMFSPLSTFLSDRGL